MIITREMFDEFIESAENHTILWTDTLALIGVTVGDVPDVNVIDTQAAEIARLRGAIAWLEPPFVDADTSHDELKKRVGFCVADAKRAALAQETQP